MGINRFIYLLLILSVLFIFYKKDIVSTHVKPEEKPLVVFNDSVMYDLSLNSIEYIIQSQRAFVYEAHNELYDAVIMSRVDKKQSDSVEIDNLSARNIVKHGDNIYLNDDVRYDSYDGLIFKTESLQYNIKSKIATNDTYFDAVKEKHTFDGDTLYYDSMNKKMRAGNTHFKIGLKETDENSK